MTTIEYEKMTAEEKYDLLERTDKETKRCAFCGAEFEVTNLTKKAVYCTPRCQDEAYNFGRRKSKEMINVIYENNSIEVVYDPLPEEEGGFSVGARFSQEQLICMISPEMRSLTDGTKIRDLATGRVWQVDYSRYDVI